MLPRLIYIKQSFSLPKLTFTMPRKSKGLHCYLQTGPDEGKSKGLL